MHRTVLLSTAALVASLFWGSTAFADASVRVDVHDAGGKAVDGRVSLTNTADSTKRFSCVTSAGRCAIAGVPGGRYTVVFRPKQGNQNTVRKVMIPPSGEVKLSVTAK